MPRIRVHQHVNPLATFFRNLPVEPLELERIFKRPDLPLFIDIGSARGHFLLQMAELDSGQNYVGLEIREPLVVEANRMAESAGLTNVYFQFCNATMALGKLLENIPDGILKTVSIQFPDPWFKKKHAKRRMVKVDLVEPVVNHLRPGGRIVVQTDIEFLAEEMFALFSKNPTLREIRTAENPFPVKTEREAAVEAANKRIFRKIFEKIA